MILSDADHYILAWGPNRLEFDDLQALKAFVAEQGADSFTCWPIWVTQAT